MKTTLFFLMGLFATAAMEAFTPTSFLVPGTLAVAGAGGMIVTGSLPLLPAFLATFAGTFLGDLASYLLARVCRTRLQSRSWFKAAESHAAARLGGHPWHFVLISKICPYAKSGVALGLGAVGFPMMRFLRVGLLAAAVDSGFFLGLGALATLLGKAAGLSSGVSIVGAVALLVLIGLWLTRRKPDTSSGNSPSKRGAVFLVKCGFLLVFWELTGMVAKRAGFFNRTSHTSARTLALAKARHGDIVAIGRERCAPWGMRSHVALVIESPWGKFLIHAYEGLVQICAADQFPAPGRIAVLEVLAPTDLRDKAVAEAMNQLGKPFKLCSTKPGSLTPDSFSCVTLVDWAYSKAGISLTNAQPGSFIVPDDLTISSSVRLKVDLAASQLRQSMINIALLDREQKTSDSKCSTLACDYDQMWPSYDPDAVCIANSTTGWFEDGWDTI